MIWLIVTILLTFLKIVGSSDGIGGWNGEICVSKEDIWKSEFGGSFDVWYTFSIFFYDCFILSFFNEILDG